MSSNELIPSLFSMTLIAVLVVAVVGFVFFMRKRSNRHPMDTPRGEAIQRERDADVIEAREEDTTRR